MTHAEYARNVIDLASAVLFLLAVYLLRRRFR
jgi:hypothetical protein